MNTDKDRVTRLLADLPDDTTFDEILRELAFARMVEKGLADSKAGRTITTAELKRRVRFWRKAAGR